MAIKPGIRLGERYQLLSPIATGGMGQVWRAEDTTLHRVVAAKILRSEFTGDETFLARFRAEARNTASLSHPNIASVYDYGEQVHDSERMCYLIMELVDGKPLVDILAKERRLSPSRTMDYLEQTAMGLAAAHREGMVHRDIKPGNLIIRPDGVLKITDFGIARAANSVALTEQGTVVGTAQYLAPEQAEGKPARPASDVYALGVVGYECLAGVRPFDGDNSVAIALAQIRDMPRPLPADVPQNVRALIELTLRKNPDARYQDGGAFVAAVKAVRAGGMPTAPPQVPVAAPAPPRQLPGGPRLAPPPGGPGPGRPNRPGPGAGPGGAGPGGGGPAAGPAGGGPGGAGPGGAGPGGQRPMAGPAGQRPAPGPARPGPARPGMPPAPGPKPAAPRTGQQPYPSPSSATGGTAFRPPSGGETSTRLPPISGSSGPPANAGQTGSLTGALPGALPGAAPSGATPAGGPPSPGAPPSAGGPQSPGGPPSASSGAEPERRTPWPWILLVGLLLIAIIVTLIVVLSGGDDQTPQGMNLTTVFDLLEEPR